MVVETQEQLNIDHHPSAFHRVGSATVAPQPPAAVVETNVGAGTMPTTHMNQHNQLGTGTAAQQHQYILAMLQQVDSFFFAY
ncbi:hypothetical protein niasHT_032390 [Heterodera trifolii]|uniref:Uncharacterized protein n=1 Tax=Heterodera trifolii TaxID=157864 RepID=A0ABD2I013_9BILA